MGKHSIALAMFCGLVFGIGCAQGIDNTSSGDDAITTPDAMDDDPVHIDASPLPIDASPLPIDASPLPIDAAPMIDAPTGGTGSCTSSAQCGGGTPCCLIGFNQCFPDPGNPLFCS